MTQDQQEFPFGPPKQKQLTQNEKKLDKRFLSHLNDIFRELKEDSWKILPSLSPKQHFYTPSTKLIDPAPSEPLILDKCFLQLKKELKDLDLLLKRRKTKFESDIAWDESDDEELFSSSSDSEQDFEVESIISRRTDEKGTVFYLVVWKDYPGEDTWVRSTHLDNAIDAIADYEDNL